MRNGILVTKRVDLGEKRITRVSPLDRKVRNKRTLRIDRLAGRDLAQRILTTTVQGLLQALKVLHVMDLVELGGIGGERRSDGGRSIIGKGKVNIALGHEKRDDHEYTDPAKNYHLPRTVIFIDHKPKLPFLYP
ncbi:MAG: hypothetical protein BWY49_00524 [Candidatus Omnitrophica bacterium ADurb.Bin314]|nr:MAG: hypothetical protein BWY49_00524 [Candidatus Omnitrophica bacterium ADurb.Bin314]